MALHVGCYTMILLMNVLSILHSFVLNVYKNNASIKGCFQLSDDTMHLNYRQSTSTMCVGCKRGGAEKIKITRR